MHAVIQTLIHTTTPTTNLKYIHIAVDSPPHLHTLTHTHTELFFDTESSQMVPLEAGGRPSKYSVPLSYYWLPKVHVDRAFSPENT